MTTRASMDVKSSNRSVRMWTWVVPILLGIVLFADYVEGRQPAPKTRSCKGSDTWFRPRKRYQYGYEVAVDMGFVGTSDVTSGYVLSCDVEVYVPRKCELTMELTSCKLKERGLDGKLKLSANSKQLAKELEKDELFVQMDGGRVLDHQIVVNQSEPVCVTNIKRAIVSQFQLYILNADEYDSQVEQVDIFGKCPTRYVFSNGGVTTHRDITKCDVPQVFRRLKSFFSLAKQVEAAVFSKPLSELIYPFESQVECSYTIQDRSISTSRCFQTQNFKPVTFQGQLRAAAGSNITQSLTLKTVSKIPRRKSVISRGLDGRKLVDLYMELNLPSTPEVTSADLFAQLQSLLTTYSTDSEALPPERFRELVDQLRGASEVILSEVLETLLVCRGPKGCALQAEVGKMDLKLVQKRRESLFADGLLSCASEPCISTYIAGLQRGLVYSLQGEMTLFNMGLFYQPTPTILGNMLSLCKSRESSNCWLTLGTFVSKLAEEVKGTKDKMFKDAAMTAIRDVLQQLRVPLGDSCRVGVLQEKPGDEHYDTVASLLVTLKALGNAGWAIQDYHDDVIKTGKGLVPAILQCVENPRLPLKVSQAAFLVLRKLQLRKDVRTTLLGVLSDTSRPASLRTETFDLLLRHDHVDTIRVLLKAAGTEKLKSLQLYMVTRVAHLLESNSPYTASLRKLWRQTMKQETSQLPPPESFTGRGSQYVEVSRYIPLPLSGMPVGTGVGIKVVYDPASILPSTVRVSFQISMGTTILEIFEVGLDIEGLENIARELFGKDLNIRKDGPGAIIAKITQAALPKTGKPPSFFLADGKVVESLKKLFLKVNMPTGDLPQAQFQLRVFGNDVGFVHLEDLIVMVKQGSRGDKSPNQMFTLMQQLAEGLTVFVGKSLKMVEVEKIIPTVGGLPWHAKVHGTMAASAVLNAGGDVMTFLKRRGPLEIKGGLTSSLAVKVWCEKSVRIADAASAGLRLNVSILVNGVLGGRMKYVVVPAINTTQKAQILELGLTALKQPLNVVRVRSDVFLLHNDVVQPVATPATQVTVKRCSPDLFQKWLGQNVCLDGFYQPVTLSADTPIPPLSGPVHLDIIARPVDQSLQEYTAVFTLTRQEEEGQPGVLVVFKVDCAAQGDKMKRHLNVSLAINTAAREVQLKASVPEIGLVYDFTMCTTYGSSAAHSDHTISSLLSVGPKVLHTFIAQFRDSSEKKGNLHPRPGEVMHYTESERVFKLNVSVPGLSAELLTSTSSGKQPGHFTQDVVFRYYCEPDLGIFYKLHPSADHAARNGHVSEYSFHNEATMNGASLATMSGASPNDFWRALDTMVIIVPGYNVTLQNKMAANYSFAQRDTEIYWTSGVGSENETLNVIYMDAEVSNKSTEGRHHYHYSMDLDHQDMYKLNLQGDLQGAAHDISFHTNVVYKAKSPVQRRKRSFKSFFSKLKTAEDAVEDTIVSLEEAVLRRGAELTESFLTWLSGDSPSGSSPPVPPPVNKALLDRDGAVADGVPDGVAAPDALMAMGPAGRLAFRMMAPGPLIMLFARPQWTLDFDANLKVKPVMGDQSPAPIGYDCEWDLNITLPDLNKLLLASKGTLRRQKEVKPVMGGQSPAPIGSSCYWDLNITLPDLNKLLLASNGTLHRQKGWDGAMAGRLATDVMNFTLDFDWEQRWGPEWPLFFHQQHWTLVEFAKHRFDRSFGLMFDLERHNQMSYSLDLVSPKTNLSHAIAFRTVSPFLRTIRHSMNLHISDPPFDINHNESSDLTVKGLASSVKLNSTWLDLDMDLDSDFSVPGVLLIKNHVDVLGKVSFFNGSRQVDFDLKLNPRDRSSPPSLMLTLTNATGHRRNLQGQVLAQDHLLFVASTREPKGKQNITTFQWNIHLSEPTELQHRLVWKPEISRYVKGAARHFLSAGAHSLRHFGHVMANNMHRKFTDHVIPFTNMTISEAVDRVVQGQMKKVAMSGLDPAANVPLSVKVIQGGLKVTESLQTVWANSHAAEVAQALGVHSVASTAIVAATGWPRLILEDPPFFARQYIAFNIQPRLHETWSRGQFNFSHPIPVAWDSFLSWPRAKIFWRQLGKRAAMMKVGAKADLPFLAIVADNKIQTFDGTTFDITVPGKSGCTYLLATDFVHGNHSLLLSPDDVTMVTPTANVAIGWSGSVAINDSQRIVSELPSSLKSDPSNVILRDGQLIVNVPGQLRMTYDPITQIYVLETARHVHNRSLGLLGTTSLDPGDDFRLPDGKMASEAKSFQKAYELSQSRKCDGVVPVTSGFSCNPDLEQFCGKLFTQSSSPLAACFAVVSPTHFHELCLRRGCSEIPQKTENACPIVHSYVKLCVNRDDVTLDTGALSAMCDDCQATSGKELDVVVGLAQSEKGLKADDIAGVIRNFASQLERADARFGLVHSDWRAAQAQLFNGELFVMAREIKSVPKKDLVDESGVTRSLEALVRAAAQYPFRTHARRLLVVIVDDQYRVSSDVEVEDFQQLLWEKDISLVLVADDKNLDKAEPRVLAATWDQRVLCKNCDKEDISLPDETKVGELAQMSRGLWISGESTARARPGRMRGLVRTFKHIARQPSPRCAKGGA